LKISAKKVVLSVSSGKKQISLLLSPLEKIWKNPLVVPPGKYPSDAHLYKAMAAEERRRTLITERWNIVSINETTLKLSQNTTKSGKVGGTNRTWCTRNRSVEQPNLKKNNGQRKRSKSLS